MPVVTPRRLAGAAAVPALALGLAACSSGSSDGSDEDAGAPLSPEQVVLASYEGLDGESYQMQTVMTINDLDFLEMTNVVEGEASQVSQDLRMSAMLEASGEEIPEDPEMAAMMESMFADVHTETILVDDVIYLQFSGGAFDTSEQFGQDAWFTADLAEFGDLSEVYEQVGSFDLASQTEQLINELSDVEETGDGVYTGTLSADSEIMQEMAGTTGAVDDPAAEEVIDGAEVTITVDGDGLLETMEISFPDIEGMTMHMVSEVLEVGGEYGITAPESDNLHPFEDFVNSMQ